MRSVRILAGILALLLILNLAGCQNTEQPAEKENENPSQIHQTAEALSANITSKETSDAFESHESVQKAEEIHSRKDSASQRTESTMPEVSKAPQKEKETALQNSEPAKPPAAASEKVEQNTVETKREKSIYDFPFNIEEIRKELIAVGESMGLVHIVVDDGVPITKDNASWANPVTASESFQGAKLRRALKDYVQSMPKLIKSYGGEEIKYFTIYTESLGNGSYRIYFLY